MSASEKENIYVELRQYHLEQFPDQMVNSNMESLRKSFLEFEDKIVTMLVGLVNGKVAYEDLSEELKAFGNKVKILPSGDRAEDNDRNFFKTKIEHLEKMLSLGELANFKLKIPRAPKALHGHLRQKETRN